MKDAKVPVQLIENLDAAEKAVQGMGWDSGAHFEADAHNDGMKLADLVGTYEMTDVGGQPTGACGVVAESGPCFLFMENRIYPGAGRVYSDANGQCWMNEGDVL